MVRAVNYLHCNNWLTNLACKTAWCSRVSYPTQRFPKPWQNWMYTSHSAARTALASRYSKRRLVAFRSSSLMQMVLRRSLPTMKLVSSYQWRIRASPLHASWISCSIPSNAPAWEPAAGNMCCGTIPGNTVLTSCSRRIVKRYVWRVLAPVRTRHETALAAGGGQLLDYSPARIPELLRACSREPGRQAGNRLCHPERHHDGHTILLSGVDAHAGLSDRPQRAARTLSVYGAGGLRRRHHAIAACLCAAPPLDRAAGQFHYAQ